MSVACPQKSKFSNDPDYICNPTTGKWVKKTGPTGQLILAGKIKPKTTEQIKEMQMKMNLPKNCPPESKFANKPGYVCNPKTGKWIKKAGPTSYKISEQMKSPHDYELISIFPDINPKMNLKITHSEYDVLQILNNDGIKLTDTSQFIPKMCFGGSYDVYYSGKFIGSIQCITSGTALIASLYKLVTDREKFKLSTIFGFSSIDDLPLTEEEYEVLTAMKDGGLELKPYAGTEEVTCVGKTYDIYVIDEYKTSLPCVTSGSQIIKEADKYMLTFED